MQVKMVEGVLDKIQKQSSSGGSLGGGPSVVAPPTNIVPVGGPTLIRSHYEGNSRSWGRGQFGRYPNITREEWHSPALAIEDIPARDAPEPKNRDAPAGSGGWDMSHSALTPTYGKKEPWTKKWEDSKWEETKTKWEDTVWKDPKKITPKWETPKWETPKWDSTKWGEDVEWGGATEDSWEASPYGHHTEDTWEDPSAYTGKGKNPCLINKSTCK